MKIITFYALPSRLLLQLPWQGVNGKQGSLLGRCNYHNFPSVSILLLSTPFSLDDHQYSIFMFLHGHQGPPQYTIQGPEYAQGYRMSPPRKSSQEWYCSKWRGKICCWFCGQNNDLLLMLLQYVDFTYIMHCVLDYTVWDYAPCAEFIHCTCFCTVCVYLFIIRIFLYLAENLRRIWGMVKNVRVPL